MQHDRVIVFIVDHRRASYARQLTHVTSKGRASICHDVFGGCRARHAASVCTKSAAASGDSSPSSHTSSM